MWQRETGESPFEIQIRLTWVLTVASSQRFILLEVPSLEVSEPPSESTTATAIDGADVCLYKWGRGRLYDRFFRPKFRTAPLNLLQFNTFISSLSNYPEKLNNATRSFFGNNASSKRSNKAPFRMSDPPPRPELTWKSKRIRVLF